MSINPPRLIDSVNDDGVSGAAMNPQAAAQEDANKLATELGPVARPIISQTLEDQRIGRGVPTTCIEHGPGGTLRLTFQIKVF